MFLDVDHQALNYLFDTVRPIYDARRLQLKKLNPKNETGTTVIDHILQSSLGNEQVLYPPADAESCIQYYENLSDFAQKLLFIYLRHELAAQLSSSAAPPTSTSHRQRREPSSGRSSKEPSQSSDPIADLQALQQYLHQSSVTLKLTTRMLKLATGFWSLDNQHSYKAVALLCHPSIDLKDFFAEPKEIVSVVVDELLANHSAKLASYFLRVHRYGNWDESYDPKYTRLQVGSNQLIEALKYERNFCESNDYRFILKSFFEQCAENRLMDTITRFKLTIDEEEALNDVNQKTRRTHARSQASKEAPKNSKETDKSQNLTATIETPKNTSLQSSRNRPKVLTVPSSFDSPARNTRASNRKKKLVR